MKRGPRKIEGKVAPRNCVSRRVPESGHFEQKARNPDLTGDLIKDLADLYRLAADDLLQLDGFAKKSANQLHEAIQNTKKPRLDRFLYALGIRHVGERVAGILARRYGSLEDLEETSAKDLRKIADIGPEIAAAVVEFFVKNQQVLERLLESGIDVQPLPTNSDNQPLRGKNFVFSGKLKDYTRAEAEKAVEDLGGIATSHVSGQTDYLVVGEHAGSKYAEAKKLKIKIFDEQAFKSLLAKYD